MLQLLENPRHHPRHRKGRRHNPTVANPSRGRKHRRNPFGLDKTTERFMGVSIEQMLGGGLGYVGTEYLASMVDPMINAGLARPASTVVDPIYALRKAAPNAVVAVVIHMLGKNFVKSREIMNAVTIGAGASTGAKFVAALHILPANVLTDGSQIIGHREPAHALPSPGNQTQAHPVQAAIAGDIVHVTRF